MPGQWAVAYLPPRSGAHGSCQVSVNRRATKCTRRVDGPHRRGLLASPSSRHSALQVACGLRTRQNSREVHSREVHLHHSGVQPSVWPYRTAFSVSMHEENSPITCCRPSRLDNQPKRRARSNIEPNQDRSTKAVGRRALACNHSVHLSRQLEFDRVSRCRTRPGPLGGACIGRMGGTGECAVCH
jgi:hypothetical protein